MGRYATSAIVLRRREYADYDLILTVLSPEKGKHTLIAKSAKKSAKRFPGILEPFNELQITYRPGRRKGMAVLEEASLKQPFGRIRSDFIKTAYASYWVECIALWLEEGQGRIDLYQLLLFVLNGLEESRLSPEVLSILFQMRFIGQEGLQPVLARCSCCQSDLNDMDQLAFCVDLKRGGVVCGQCPSNGHSHLRLARGTLRQLEWISGGDLGKATRAKFTASAIAEATAFLELFVPYHIGRRPKSLKILQQVRYQGSHTLSPPAGRPSR
jgi:DNA repair protein RecO (recombination protein O)